MRLSTRPLAICALAALAFSAVAAMRVPDDEKRQIDTWLLEGDDLDEFGNPRGTMYTGGTPLFDESAGRRVDRYEYIVRAHPDKPWATPRDVDDEPPSSFDAEPPTSANTMTKAVKLDVQEDDTETGGRFPSRWGPEPAAQTRDYRELPGGYGFGSSTLYRWIEQNMAKDAAAAAPAPDDLRRR